MFYSLLLIDTFAFIAHKEVSVLISVSPITCSQNYISFQPKVSLSISPWPFLLHLQNSFSGRSTCKRLWGEGARVGTNTPALEYSFYQLWENVMPYQRGTEHEVCCSCQVIIFSPTTFFPTNCPLWPNRWIGPSDICLKCQITSPRLCPSLHWSFLSSKSQFLPYSASDAQHFSLNCFLCLALT